MSYFLRITFGVIAAVAVLVLILAWVLRQPNFGSLPFPGERRADAAKLEEHVRFLTAAGQWRNPRNPTGLDRAASYIAEAFRRTSAQCSEPPYQAGSIQARNVVAIFGLEARPRIVVGAHYDVFGDHPGADDNASGVAGLLELARLLDATKLPVTVELVAYSTEEPPFFGGAEMGSAVHADGLARSGVPVHAMISLEMIGYFEERQPSQGLFLDLIYPRHGQFVALVGRWAERDLVGEAKKCFRGATRVEAVSYSGPVGLGADLSDQRNYWAAGFPAFMVTDTAFMRNLNYHGPTDTAETLDYQRMAGVVDGVFSTIVHLATY